MTVWVECPNCGGKVGIPDAAPTDIPCPTCKYALLTSRPLERTRRLPNDSAPSWMRPWGYAFTIIGGLAFAAGVIDEYSASRDPPMVAVIVGGLLNSIFFIGLPLGVYWLRRSKKIIPLPPSPVANQTVSYRVKNWNNPLPPSIVANQTVPYRVKNWNNPLPPSIVANQTVPYRVKNWNNPLPPSIVANQTVPYRVKNWNNHARSTGFAKARSMQ